MNMKNALCFVSFASLLAITSAHAGVNHIHGNTQTVSGDFNITAQGDAAKHVKKILEASQFKVNGSEYIGGIHLNCYDYSVKKKHAQFELSASNVEAAAEIKGVLSREIALQGKRTGQPIIECE